MEVYGNLTNRLNEGRIFTEDKLIHEGDDVTSYSWSDRNCYFVTKVIDQKHIFIHPYSICADHSKELGMGHQDWMYFKTISEMNEYLNKYSPSKNNDICVKEHNDIELVFRYNKWKHVCRNTEKPSYFDFGKLSFGTRDYYYDWEF